MQAPPLRKADMTSPSRPKSYLGPTFRLLRERAELSLQACAKALELSPSYLSQIEHNQRPVTSRVLIAASRLFGVEAKEFKTDDTSRLIADLREATFDIAHEAPAPTLEELKLAASTTPALAQQFLALHRHYRTLDERFKRLSDRPNEQPTNSSDSLPPYQEVRDFFHYRENYIESLDLAAESLAESIGIGQTPSDDLANRLAGELYKRWRIEIVPTADTINPTEFHATGLIRRYDERHRKLYLARDLAAPTRVFQLASQIAELEFHQQLQHVLTPALNLSHTARSIAKVGLVNYAAGALLMPYAHFLKTSRMLRHDIEQLQRYFGTSFEQTCHRLSTLQRPGMRGIPFYFVRVDLAGNITKRHSQTRFQFARYGGACPLWNVHESFSHPGRIMVQLAEMPDGVKYLCIGRAIVKRSGNYLTPNRQYAVGFGCEIRYAAEIVYSQGLNLSGQATPIGVSCSLCERTNCAQRAYPAMDRPLQVTEGERRIVPYTQTISD
jgi:hypothetical protein